MNINGKCRSSQKFQTYENCCPECGYLLESSCGCMMCRNCGYSPCG